MTNKEIRLHNLQRLLEHSGLSKTAFAVKVNTSPAYISQMLSSKTRRAMGEQVARGIEYAYGKQTGWMDALHPPEEYLPETVRRPKIESNAEWYGGFEIIDDDQPPGADEVSLPYYRELDIANGPGRTEVIEYHQQKQRFAKSVLKAAGVPAAAAFCAIISGSSMEPVLPEGATLGIDTSRTTVRDGELYALDHAGGLRVKIVYRMPGGGLRLRSYNHEEWPDENYTAEEAASIRVLGRVFWWSVLR
ncbi:MAG: helix-turn-helix transcriptional regulator [Methylococcales bacterium]|nr:helix-turn-helix transcriptional regulator [Methylococcales bacterium]